jgi:hypothetical protein
MLHGFAGRVEMELQEKVANLEKVELDLKKQNRVLPKQVESL